MPDDAMTHLRALTPDASNRRAHNPRNVGMLVDALHSVGAARSIVIDEAGVILAGNATVEAAAEAGIERVRVVDTDGETLIAVRRTGLSEAQKRALAIYDNRTAELASWNLEQIQADAVAGLDLEPFWTEAERIKILGRVGRPGRTDPDDVPAPRATTIRPGDRFALGRHRLVCGDCTRPDVVAWALGSAVPAVVATSPPYADQREYTIGTFDWTALLCGAFDAVVSRCAPTTHILINLGMAHKDRAVDPYWAAWLDHCAAAGWPLFGWYVWDKGAGMPGAWNGRLAPAHEFVFHFNNERRDARKWVATTGRTQVDEYDRFRQKDGTVKPATSPDKIGQPFKVPDSVIRIPRELARGIATAGHPAVFSVAFVSFLITTWSEPGESVLDPFVGSGTSIVACEAIDRPCVGIEVEPSYCQVAIDRWEAFTGRLATRIEDGAP